MNILILGMLAMTTGGVISAPPAHMPTPYQDLTNYHYYDLNYDNMYNADGDDYSGSTLNDNVKLEELEEALTQVLRSGEEPPIVFLEDVPSIPLTLDNQQQPQDGYIMAAPSKRTRFYRRYGNSKRQTAKYYDPDGYLCAPSREDVFRLLIALHEVRNGVNDKTIHFCNRKRPARAVFTNIRFLGRKRR